MGALFSIMSRIPAAVFYNFYNFYNRPGAVFYNFYNFYDPAGAGFYNFYNFYNPSPLAPPVALCLSLSGCLAVELNRSQMELRWSPLELK